MKHLPKIKTIEISETQQAWCGLWLQAYEIDQEVNEAEVEESEMPDRDEAPATALQVAPYAAEPVTVGQIRMMAGSLTPEAEAPVYVAIIGERDGEFLVTPYSRFSVPAFMSELYMGWDEDELATLCIWNTHTLRPESLSASWVVDTLSASESEAALSAFQTFLFGEPLPDALKNRIGAPILYPDDPRIGYQSEETRRCQGLGRLQALEDEAEEREEAKWLVELVRDAETIIAFPVPKLQLLAAAGAEGEVKHHALIYQNASDPHPRESFATSDMSFEIKAGQEEIPLAQWELAEESPELAGARVLWMLRKTRKVFAMGLVDESGSVLDVEELRTDEIQKPITEEDDILICIFAGGSSQ